MILIISGFTRCTSARSALREAAGLTQSPPGGTFDAQVDDRGCTGGAALNVLMGVHQFIDMLYGKK
jgi:hypothetical protein